jgi:response regulator RpfG family c-di-GMP phosphodiesterase
MLGLSSATETALRHVFEAWDGGGVPGVLAGDAVPPVVLMIAVACDLEIFARVHGLERAQQLIAQRAGARYPQALAALAAAHAGAPAPA